MPLPSPTLCILAFEPFDAGSHRAVRESISRHAQHEWVWLTRPGRSWKWRMRLAAIEMVDQAAGEGLLDQRWDAIFCTSLMSAADLRAVLPPRLRSVPLVLSMHENQAAYPAGFMHVNAGDRDVHFAMTNLASILAADRALWNSEWNKRSFIEGIEFLLMKGSDVRLRQVRERIEAKSTVVWPPVEPPPSRLPERSSGAADDPQLTDIDAKPRAAHVAGVLHNAAGPVRVVWPHRWEHDKGPDELLAIAERWSEELDLRWTILGERYRDAPPEMDEFARRFRARIDHIGFIPERGAYWDALRQCDWILSTARHEFFGIAVVEALLAGCLPWLPDRLSYPELLPEVAGIPGIPGLRNISPMNPPEDAAAAREAVKLHLEPALAPNAVGRIEQEIEAAIRRVLA